MFAEQRLTPFGTAAAKGRHGVGGPGSGVYRHAVFFCKYAQSRYVVAVFMRDENGSYRVGGDACGVKRGAYRPRRATGVDKQRVVSAHNGGAVAIGARKKRDHTYAGHKPRL